MRKFCCLAIVLLMPATTFADGLTQLRAALGRYRATAPVSGSVDVHVVQTSEAGKRQEQGRATVEFDSTAQRLSLSFPARLIDRMRAEERQQNANPDAAVGRTSSAIEEMSAGDLALLLNSAEELLSDLQRATLSEERATVVDGRAARLLLITLEPRLSKAQRKHVKSTSATLQVTTTNDYVPLSSVQTLKVKASFLVVSFDSTMTDSRVYAARNDRLVAVRRQLHRSGSGLGQKFRSDVTAAVTLK